MQFNWTNALAVTALVASAAVATAQSADKKGTYIGLEAGAYFPSDRVIRSVFGSTVPRVGLSFVNNSQADQLKTSFDFAVIGANRNGSRFVAIPVTFGVGRQYGTPITNIRPYWRAGAGAAYLDYSIDPNNSGNPTTAHKVGFTAVGEVGVLLSDRVRLSASYDYFTKQDDFNFTGFEIKATFLFWKL